MAYTAELCGCVEDERWEGLPKVSAASDYRNASDVCRPPLETIGGGGGGAVFTEGGHYSTSEFCPRGTLFTGELCPGGQYSPVNNVQGDILWGDSVHYDNVIQILLSFHKPHLRYKFYSYTQVVTLFHSSMVSEKLHF